MKKIISVLFFAGFLTTASFAQWGHRQQNKNRFDGNGYPSDQNSRDHSDQYAQNSRNDQNDYGNHERNYRKNENDYQYSDQREHGGRGYRGDDDDRWHESYYPGYDNHEGRENNRYRNYRRGSWFEIMHSRRDRH